MTARPTASSHSTHAASAQSTPSAALTVTENTLILAPTPALPTGNFQLRENKGNETNGCLNSSSTQSWNCTMPSSYLLEISLFTGGFAMHSGAQSNSSIPYGHGPMQFEGAIFFQGSDGHSGSYNFNVTYDKRVALPATAFSSQSRRRDQESHGAGFKHLIWDTETDLLQRRQSAEPGDTLWYCFWNASVITGSVHLGGTTQASTQQSVPVSFDMIEEPSSSSIAKPYCQLFKVINDGSLGLIRHQDGSPIVLSLDLSTPHGDCYCGWSFPWSG